MKDMTMGELVDILPKNGTAVRIGSTIFSYEGEISYDQDWQ